MKNNTNEASETQNKQQTLTRMTGYKATSSDMKCRGVQFELNKWYEVEGPFELCANGFHFCEQPSGVWSYYSSKGTRVFKIEAEQVLVTPYEPGADRKFVARRIRLTQEVVFADDKSNTGDGNTGDGNTGYGNTGYGNTGNRNTGYGNVIDYSSGFFCQEPQTVVCFDGDTGLTRDEFTAKFPVWQLVEALSGDEPIDFQRFAMMPNIAPEKLASLHEKHIAARKAARQ